MMAIKTVRFQTADEAMVTAARSVAQKLNRAGFRALFAGGSVRDALLERPVKDIDIATSATPDQVEALFAGQTVAVGKAFGVVLVLRDGFQFDVATFRTDGPYADGRHPERVTFATAEGDAQRRDFTVNGLFCEPESGEVVDYVEGRADLAARVIRAIGEPEARFREDHLRMLRAIRFASVLGFQIEPATYAAVKAHAAWIKTVSAERIAMEFIRLICESPQPSLGLNLLRETGLLSHFLPELVAVHGIAQPPQFHPEGDVWTHTCLMLDEMVAPREPVLALAVLLHDIGKPVTFCQTLDPATGETHIRFAKHAVIGAELAEAVLLRLRQPSARTAEVKALVLGHMHFVEAMKMRPAKVRRFLGMSHFPRMLELMRLDTLHSNKDFTTWRFLKEAFEAFTSEPVLPEPLVHGRDLIAWGVPPGPDMGSLLNELYDAQLEGRITSVAEAHDYVGHSTVSGKRPYPPCE